jgi:hypothetical protein
LNEAKTKRKRSENCHHFRFEAKLSEMEAKFFPSIQKKGFLLVFASEVEQK